MKNESEYYFYRMKSVILIRHIKSDWSNLVPDFDRPVREDRREDALLIAKEITQKGNLPEYIVSSPAMRALQTARLLCARWDYPAENIATDRSIYECGPGDIFSLITRIDNQYSTIAIVCHNPAITDFVNRYSGTYLINVPTTGAVHITFDTQEWRNIEEKGKVNWVLRPKELKATISK
jgi:phosphohistidine phosphatase